MTLFLYRPLASERVVCEHAFSGVKRYRIAADVYRNRKDGFDDRSMLTAAGLCRRGIGDDTEILQNFDNGHARIGVEHVHDTGHEPRNAFVFRGWTWPLVNYCLLYPVPLVPPPTAQSWRDSRPRRRSTGRRL